MPRRICLTLMSLLAIAASLGAQARGGSSVTGTLQSQDGSPASRGCERRQSVLLDPSKPLEDVVVTLRDRNSQ